MSRLVICGICAAIAAVRPKAAESEVNDGTQSPPLPPVTQLSSSNKDLWLAFKNWKSGQPQSWTGDAMKVGAVGAQQRWCFVETWHFQPSSFLWKEGDAPIAEVNISLTCPGAGRDLGRQGPGACRVRPGSGISAERKRNILRSSLSISQSNHGLH